MKATLNLEKNITYIKSKQKNLPLLAVLVVMITFGILTYFALFPKEDSAHLLEGESRVKGLDIRFDTRLLNELGATKTPAQLGTTGGRDPFSGF